MPALNDIVTNAFTLFKQIHKVVVSISCVFDIITTGLKRFKKENFCHQLEIKN